MQVQITITADLSTGNVGVNGPLDKPGIVLHVLEVAKHVVTQQAVQNELKGGPGILLANRLPPQNGVHK